MNESEIYIYIFIISVRKVTARKATVCPGTRTWTATFSAPQTTTPSACGTSTATRRVSATWTHCPCSRATPPWSRTWRGICSTTLCSALWATTKSSFCGIQEMGLPSPHRLLRRIPPRYSLCIFVAFHFEFGII